MDFFENSLDLPLEREYEAWIVRGIQDYFRDLGWECTVFAISPADEHTYPVDEAMFFGYKFIGLQFKRPSLRNGVVTPSFADLKWNMGQPRGQFNRVVAHPEIYYVLPTFCSRGLFRQALHHCFFWHPPDATYRSKVFWYWNRRIRDGRSLAVKPQDEVMRWGQLVEQVSSCSAGIPVEGHQAFGEYIDRLQESYFNIKSTSKHIIGRRLRYIPGQVLYGLLIRARPEQLQIPS